ncbi:hypothetical protein Vadar_027906 [Vaccinium darrowii]|uniref:Uncharacterized protein n=1 Tax=Vaccinium darrowii TaxID=229202 RepID=A0ACB7Y9A3_9ERIC|nr:hypothetical protein Vadar_027906 [Vaccinium darrowii]
MRSVVDDVGEHDSVINSKDRDGNTIFHLAAAVKQKETHGYQRSDIIAMELYQRNTASAREAMDKKLYEASISGNVQALQALTEEDGLLLHIVSLTWLGNTLAHIAAMCGHRNFTRALLSRKPTFASELDSLGRSPLYAVCVKGHVDVIQEFLQADKSVCKFHDMDGRTPFHFAAARDGNSNDKGAGGGVEGAD